MRRPIFHTLLATGKDVEEVLVQANRRGWGLPTKAQLALLYAKQPGIRNFGFSERASMRRAQK